jgi:hypothetical protein
MEDLASEVLSGDRMVVDRLEDLVSIGSRPTPVAFHRGDRGRIGAVLFLLHRHDGLWQAECVLAKAATGDRWIILATAGGLWPERSLLTKLGNGPLVVVEGRSGMDDEDGHELVAVAGWSRASSILAFSNGEPVASSIVAPHGAFVLTAATTVDAPIDLRNHLTSGPGAGDR